MKYILLFTTFLFAGELEIDGDLTVLGNVNAPGLSGMKPERIYSMKKESQQELLITAPDSTVWQVIIHNQHTGQALVMNGVEIRFDDMVGNEFILLPGESISHASYQFNHGSILINIYEYPISATGTSQGMNYVEP